MIYPNFLMAVWTAATLATAGITLYFFARQFKESGNTLTFRITDIYTLILSLMPASAGLAHIIQLNYGSTDKVIEFWVLGLTIFMQIAGMLFGLIDLERPSARATESVFKRSILLATFSLFGIVVMLLLIPPSALIAAVLFYLSNWIARVF